MHGVGGEKSMGEIPSSILGGLTWMDNAIDKLEFSAFLDADPIGPSVQKYWLQNVGKANVVVVVVVFCSEGPHW